MKYGIDDEDLVLSDSLRQKLASEKNPDVYDSL